jgi:hypothetical protein
MCHWLRRLEPLHAWGEGAAAEAGLCEGRGLPGMLLTEAAAEWVFTL